MTSHAKTSRPMSARGVSTTPADREHSEVVAAAVRHGMQGPGTPLDRMVGARFAHEFSQVRCRPQSKANQAGTVPPAHAEIGSADDPRERAADAFAGRVLSLNDASGTGSDPQAVPESRAALRHVRIHADEPAAQSARALGARAYTVGSNIVFGAGAFAPQTRAGQRLLAHELAHVAQQSAAGWNNDAALVQREPEPAAAFDDDPLAAGGFSDKDASIRVKPGAVRTTLIRPRAAPMTTEDGTPFGGKQPDDGAWIQSFLQFFNLGQVASIGTGEKYAFLSAKAPQRALSVTEVVDTVIEQGALDGHALDRTAILASIVDRVPGPAAPSDSRVSFSLTFSIVRTGHFDLNAGKTARADALGGQAAAQITWELHKANQSGPELTWVGQLTSFRDGSGPSEQYRGPFRLQSAYTGFQAGWVYAFLAGSLQIEPIFQALTGVARAQQSADGFIRLVPAAQIAAGGQVVYTIPGTGDHLQIGGQAAAAFTAPGGAHATIDLAPSIFAQWKF